MRDMQEERLGGKTSVRMARLRAFRKATGGLGPWQVLGQGQKLHVFGQLRDKFDRVARDHLVADLVVPHGLAAAGQWISRSEEEGVFLCARREQTR